MSVQTQPSETRTPGSQFDQYVEQQLESTRQQVKLTELSAGLLTLGLWMLGILLVGILIDSWLFQFGTAARIAAFALLAVGALWIAWSQVFVLFLRRIHRLYAARMIEESSDNFHNSLVNYLQVKEGGPAGKEAVVHAISQRAARDLSRISATEKVDRSRAIKLGFGFVGLVAALVAYTLLSPKSPWPSVARILNPVSSISAPSIAEVTKVTPGNTDVFFGQKLLVTAEIRGRHDPNEVKLVYSTADGQHVEVPVAMLRSGETNSYQLELATTPTGIDGPLTYYVSANDGRSETYSVSVKPNPAITVDKIEVISPSYTRLPPRTLTGQVEIEGLDGSQVKLTATANMPIQVAWVELLRQKTRGRETTYDVVRTIELRNVAQSPELNASAPGEIRHAAAGEFTLNLDANRTGQLYSHYQVLFRTVEGQRNLLVNVQPLRVTPDLPPEVKIVRPFDREVSVPLNRALEIELQAEDPDFELSKLELLLDHQGGRLLDEQIKLGENLKQQRLTGNYRFDPRKLKLSVGDIVLFHARASDNRVASVSGQPEPNVARTENYSIKIAAPLETEVAQKQPDNDESQSESGKSANQSANAENQSGKSESAENQNNQQAANQNESKSENKSGENQSGQAESAMNEANPSQANQDPNKPSQDTQQQPEAGGEQSNPKNQTQENKDPADPGTKPEEQQQKADEQQKSDPDRDEQKSESSGDSQSGEQSKQSSGGSGQKAQQSSGNQSSKSDQPQDGNEGESSGEAQANPDAAEKQMGKQGSGSKSDEQGSSKSGNPNQPAADPKQGNQTPNSENSQQQPAGSNSKDPNAGSEKQSSGKQSGTQPAGGQKSDGGQQGDGNQPQAGESQSSDQANSSSGAGQPQGKSESNKGNESGQPSAGNSNSGDSDKDNADQSGASDSQESDSSNPSEPLDRSASDAERFQRLQERMKRQQQSQENAQSQGGSGEPAKDQPSEAGDEKSSGNQAAAKKESQQGEKGNASEGEPSSDQQPDENNSSAASQSSKKDGETSKSGGNRDEGDKSAGDNSTGDNSTGDKSTGDKSTGDKSAGDKSTEGKQQKGERSSEQNPSQTEGEKGSGEKSSEQNSRDQDAKQGSGKQGSGEEGSEKSGSGKTGDEQAGSGGESEKEGEQSSGNGQSGQQSGEAGKSGQSSGEPGKQSGEDSQQGGNDSQNGAGKSGQGSESNQGAGQPGKSGSGGQSAAGESSGASGSSGNAAGSDNAAGSNQEISSRKDQPQAQRSPGGKSNPSSVGAGSNDSPAANYEDSPGEAEGNLEYSRKATDLVLEELRNQANNPDPELLKEMNWTEQDLKDFIARWDAMKQKAGSSNGQDRKRYEDAIRSLGLRPESVRRNVIQSRRDQLNKLSEDGAVNRPPANLANEFNSFLKNRNRVQKDK